jgi:hypothetical protein
MESLQSGVKLIELNKNKTSIIQNLKRHILPKSRPPIAATHDATYMIAGGEISFSGTCFGFESFLLPTITLNNISHKGEFGGQGQFY